MNTTKPTEWVLGLVLDSEHNRFVLHELFIEEGSDEVTRWSTTITTLSTEALDLAKRLNDIKEKQLIFKKVKRTLIRISLDELPEVEKSLLK